MSTEKFAQEQDRVPTRRLAVIGLVGLVVFGVGALWTSTVQRGANGTIRTDISARPALAGEPEIGMVYQQRFDRSIAAVKNDDARRRLESTGWADRDAGRIHVPIEQAMEAVVRQGKP
jgi:hypothetical protein